MQLHFHSLKNIDFFLQNCSQLTLEHGGTNAVVWTQLLLDYNEHKTKQRNTTNLNTYHIDGRLTGLSKFFQRQQWV